VIRAAAWQRFLPAPLEIENELYADSHEGRIHLGVNSPTLLQMKDHALTGQLSPAVLAGWSATLLLRGPVYHDSDAIAKVVK
jgi:hypothetical protein